MDRFQRPNSREDARLARQEALADAHESQLSLLRKIKLEYRRAVEILVEGYFKTLDPEGKEFTQDDVKDVIDSMQSDLDGPHYELIGRLEKKFEADVAES